MTAPADRLRDQLQSTLGASYSLERELGGGGMSRVFVARDESLGRDVVVKVLAPELAAGLSAERFAREVKLAAALQEPHIVPVLAAGATAEGLPYYTMPFVRGRSLRDRLDAGQLPPHEAVDILRDVAKALAYAHGQGIIHRDIKPENVLLHEGTAVVTDFGIAKALSASKTHAPGGTLTQIGTSLGTPAYMAPEQAAGDDVDQRSDLYAWGVMAYEMLAGAHPFAGKVSGQAMIVAHFVETPAPLAARAPGAPGAVVAVVMQCLAKDPDARPSASAELLASLSATATTPPPAAATPRAPERSIAVLPFESLSPNADDAFLADGICEEIVTDLARLKALRVTARNSSAQYKGTTKDARTVGLELGARHLLSGSVRRAGAALRVTAQLVDAEEGSQQWANRFSGTIDDVFEFQERIAREIVSALEVTLTPEEDKQLASHPIQNVQAYEWYLRARHNTMSFSERDMNDALVLLDRAMEIEGERATLLATRALALWSLFNIRVRGEEVLVEARALVDRALALNPDLAPALMARAMLEYSSEHVDGGLVLKLLLRATAAERSADAAMYLTFLLSQSCSPELGAQYASLARQIDPLSPLAVAVAAFPPVMAGSGEDALDDLAAVAHRFPEADIVRGLYGMILATVGRTSEAADMLRTCRPEGVYGTICELLYHALAGDRDRARELLANEELRNAARRDDQYSWSLAQAATAIDDHDEAMAWLRCAAERTFVNARFVAEYDHMLAPLRAHPDMPALLAHMDRRAREIAAAAGL